MINMIKKMKIGDKMSTKKGFLFSKILKRKKVQKLIIAILTFIILFFICVNEVIPEKYNLKEGDIANKDIKSSRDFIDDVGTKKKIEAVLSNIPDQYNKNVDVRNEAVEKINHFFTKALEIKKLNIDEKLKLEKLKEATLISLSRDDYIESLELSEEQNSVLKGFLIENLSKILSDPIKANNEEDIKKAQENLNYYIRNNSALNKKMRELAGNIGVRLIKPNLFFDEKRTEEYKNQIKKEIEPVIIKKNQNIVIRGQVITSEHINLMRKAGLLQENVISDVTIYLGVAAIIIIAELMIIICIFKFRKNIYNSIPRLLIIAIIMIINALFTMGGNLISPYIIPVGFVAILMSLIFDPVIAFALTIPQTAITACITNFNVETVILYIVGAISGILFTYNAQQRNNVLLGGLFTGVLNGIMIFSIGLINSSNVANSLLNSSIGLLGGMLSSILAIGILPVFEQMSDIITPIKLMELSNPNQPLLQKMLFEAPGTYHHSILVGNLAETAASEAGANPLLARAGSYYHDIGKIKRPYFFKENQITNDNPHDKITPKLSTLIITSHVKDGMELAKEYKLPMAIKDIIEQHHGTTLVKYFYAMAIKDEEETVEEASFRYEGPNPQSKEAAIVMLADSVEAGVRSLKNPTSTEIEKMVNKIVDDKIDDGQLSNCDITLKEIENVKKAFLKVLGGIFHNRIEYPEINIQDREGA